MVGFWNNKQIGGLSKSDVLHIEISYQFLVCDFKKRRHLFAYQFIVNFVNEYEAWNIHWLMALIDVSDILTTWISQHFLMVPACIWYFKLSKFQLLVTINQTEIWKNSISDYYIDQYPCITSLGNDKQGTGSFLVICSMLTCSILSNEIMKSVIRIK